MRILTLLMVSALMISTIGCHQDHNKEHHAHSHFPVTNALRMDTVLTKEYVCQIHAVQHIELRALEGGYLHAIHVDEGQLVKKGQLMFEITPQIYEAEYNKVKAEVEFAEIQYRNTKALADSNIVSVNELALAKAELDKTRAELALANAHLQFTQIRAPFDGLMDHFHVRLGSLVEEGELLTTMSDISNLWVYFNVPEAEYLDLKSQSINKDSLMNVRLLMANKKVFKEKGVVTTIEADFNHETGNIAFRATFPNPDRLLRHGETGNILMDIPLKDALIIPQKATFDIMDRKHVFVVDDSNIVRARQITIGEELPHLFTVTDGLKESDKIILDGLRKVKNGDEITYDMVSADSTLHNLTLYAE